MYPAVWVNAERQTPLYAFLRNIAVTVPTKKQQAEMGARRDSRASSDAAPIDTAEEFGIEAPVCFREGLSASHTFLSGGNNYFVRPSTLADFYRAFAAEIVHCMSSPNMYDGPYPSLNEVALQVHPVFFDVDFANYGAPTPAVQAGMSYVYRVIQECVRSFYASEISDEKWKSAGTMFVTQTLGRIKDAKSAILKWNPSINALHGSASSSRSAQGKQGRKKPPSSASLFHSSEFSICDESAMDGFGTPDSSRRTPLSPSSSRHSSSAFQSSPLSSSSATVGMMATLFDDDSNMSFTDVEELVSHSLSSWSAPSTVLAVKPCDPTASCSDDSSRNGGTASSAASMLMSNQLAADNIYMPLAQRTVEEAARVQVKIGAHVVLNNLIVSPTRNLMMRNYIIDKLTELSFNPALHNLLRLCMLTDSPAEFKASHYNKQCVKEFWSNVIDADVYKGESHKKVEWSDKKRQCLPCAIWRNTRTCDVCRKSKGRLNASEGKASIPELIHALDGDGNPLPRYNQECFYESHPAFAESIAREHSPNSEYYRDPSLHKLKQQYGVFVPAEFLGVQKRYDAQQYASVLRAVYDSSTRVNTSLSFPTNRVISSIPVPMRRGIIEQCIRPEDRTNFIFDVVKRMSIRLAVETIGVTEKAWCNMLTAGFQIPSDSGLLQSSLAEAIPRSAEKSRAPLSTDPIARDVMQQAIRACHPEWGNLSVVSMRLMKKRTKLTETTRAPFDDVQPSAIERESLQYNSVHWVITVMGAGSKNCQIARRSHSAREIIFVATPGHFFHVCPSSSSRNRPDNSTARSCVGTYGGIWRTPDQARKRLFKNPTNKAVAKFIQEIENSPRWQLTPTSGAKPAGSGESAASCDGISDDLQAQMLIESGYVLPAVSAETIKSLTNPNPFSVSASPANHTKTGGNNLSLSLYAPNGGENAAVLDSDQQKSSSRADATATSDVHDVFSAPAPKRRLFSFLESSNEACDPNI